MFKRISVDQLRVGMYLQEFCCSWMEHPFWRSGFILTDDEDLRRIRLSNVSEVWIDSAKGLDIQPGKRSISVAEAETRIDAELGQVAYESHLTDDLADNDEYARAGLICADAKKVIKAIFQEARMGRAIDTSHAEQLVEQILESVSRNGCALARLVRLKTTSDFTYMHSVAVCVLMVVLAKRLELDDQQTCSAGMAGLLHDLGKASMPLDLLHKPGKLNDDEFAVIKRHPIEGSRLLQGCGIDPIALDVCLNHHARIDGSGYPEHKKGDEISLFSRMAAVCDVYDAISSGRPYKTPWDPAESMRKMAEWTPGHFDPVVFHAFVKSIGIYPVGSLVRLSSERLGVVVGQSATSLLAPQIKVFFSLRCEARIVPEMVDLSEPDCREKIEAREDPAKWNFPDLFTLWSGLNRSPW